MVVKALIKGKSFIKGKKGLAVKQHSCKSFIKGKKRGCENFIKGKTKMVVRSL